MAEVKIDDLTRQVYNILSRKLMVKDLYFTGDALRNSYTCTIKTEFNSEEYITIIDIKDLHDASISGLLEHYLYLVFEDKLSKPTIENKQ